MSNLKPLYSTFRVVLRLVGVGLMFAVGVRVHSHAQDHQEFIFKNKLLVGKTTTQKQVEVLEKKLKSIATFTLKKGEDSYMPNPAAVFCAENLGDSVVQKDQDGNEFDVCVIDQKIIDQKTIDQKIIVDSWSAYRYWLEGQRTKKSKRK